ncbi:DUF3558 domain-containing protein [Nocardia amikacinitolerans]|uniref:DUF3558 domain-containing protein n=1 Tax=Nocardia amikacinitolerans TaxID=756689 RepID=UPI0020A51802|nr:DUF3558 domain-containing protein [Nocardia amikacinitolerans]MCP2291658.1 Protein of unknown function (DUF3558) [Nocardia amikacinitolerans]
MSRRITFALLGVVLASGAVGCVDNTSGSPTTTSTAAAALFNPCTGISDDVVRAAGADPATEESGIAGVHQPGWEICGWTAKTYFITVFSTGRTVEEFESKPGNVEFQDVTVAGRPGRQFKVEGASKDDLCDVLFPAAQGVVQLRIENKASTDGAEDPCAVLYRVGESMVPTFPR